MVKAWQSLAGPEHRSVSRLALGRWSLVAGDDVHAVVHAVGEVDVRRAGLLPHRCVARAAVVVVRVRCTVFWTEVGLGFDDEPGQAGAVFELSHEQLTKQRPRDANRVTLAGLARQT